MASIYEKMPAAAPNNANSSSGLPPTAAVQVSSADSSEDATSELEQLRDRFRKTTNALASAAHDLKTPLAILNGYIELLQSQKRMSCPSRQRIFANPHYPPLLTDMAGGILSSHGQDSTRTDR